MVRANCGAPRTMPRTATKLLGDRTSASSRRQAGSRAALPLQRSPWLPVMIPQVHTHLKSPVPRVTLRKITRRPSPFLFAPSSSNCPCARSGCSACLNATARSPSDSPARVTGAHTPAVSIGIARRPRLRTMGGPSAIEHCPSPPASPPSRAREFDTHRRRAQHARRAHTHRGRDALLLRARADQALRRWLLSFRHGRALHGYPLERDVKRALVARGAE